MNAPLAPELLAPAATPEPTRAMPTSKAASSADAAVDVKDLLGGSPAPAWYRRPWIWAVAVLFLLAAGGLWWWLSSRAADAAPAYSTQPATLGALTLKVTANGTLPPTRTISIGSELGPGPPGGRGAPLSRHRRRLRLLPGTPGGAHGPDRGAAPRVIPLPLPLPLALPSPPPNPKPCTGDRMNIHLALTPLISLVAGILILVIPRLLNFIVAAYLIAVGLIGLLGSGALRV